MSALTFVEPAARTTLNALLYGGPGSGKSTGALGAPGPVLLLNAEGASGPAFARKLYGDDQIHEVKMTGAQALDDFLVHIRRGCKEKTAVLDSMGEIYKVLVEDIAGRASGQLRGAKPQIQHYGEASQILERLVRDLRDQPINVVLICHEIASPTHDGTVEWLPFTGTNNTTPGAKFSAMVDVVGYCVTVEQETGPPKRMAQVIDGKGRRGKNREGVLGIATELDVGEWVAKYAVHDNPTTKES